MTKSTLTIDDIKTLTADDMRRVNDEISSRLHSDVVLINQLSHYIIQSGGKRLRPMLVMLSAKACNYQGKHDALLASIIEFIHTATLLHDDVVDDSDMRRGKDTANNVWGNEAAVLVGDFLYSRAFQMMVEAESMDVMALLANTTNIIAQGEVMQLLNINDPDITEESYNAVIYSKTACLFEAATQIGGMISGASEQQTYDLKAYGKHLGVAFQLIDDALDYSSSSEALGKNVGDDLAEGKPTLPLIYAMQNCNADERKLIAGAIEQGGLEHIDAITQIIKETGAIEYTYQKADEQADLAKKALSSLAESDHKQALSFLADYAVQRNQ
ncbi:MAG: octaprenyl diphosphate synthase [Gammaproteobacteria bacterium]|nr:octaprenyl diphosphate synthase [Gammaproteobacteria bacterium]